MAQKKKIGSGNGHIKADQATNGKSKTTETIIAGQPAIKNDRLASFRSLPITIHSQYLKDLSFESPAAPGIFASLKQVPEITIDVDTKTALLKDQDIHEVTVSLVSTARSGQDVVFICEVIYAGLFTLGEIPPEVVQPVLQIECPRILFPFIRAIIGEITGNAGFPPLMINPIDFSALYQKHHQKKSG